jgi:hypothetical protein
MKANCSWFFCRLSSMSRAAYSPLPLPSLRRTVWAFIRCRITTPAADFCRPVRTNHSILSPASRTNGRSPEVSSTTFRTQPPNLQPVPFDGYGLRGHVPARLALYASESGSCISARTFARHTLLSDAASRLRPCGELSLHLHQVVKGTSTPKLSNMLGTHDKSRHGVYRGG